MAKRLVIVESPAKAGTINKILGSDYQVEASFGHVRDLPRSKMGVDMANGFTPQYVIPTKSKKTVSKLKKLAKGKETIYLATDPDREGEAISWHLANILTEEGGGEIKRVMFNELTKEAVKDAFKHPRDIDTNLVNSQQARRVLDRIVGYELSPLLWKKVGRGLSAGRVQSVALRLIVERETEIRAFKPEEYWSLVAKLSSGREGQQDKLFQAKLARIGNQKVHITNETETLKIKSALENETFRVVSVQKKERRRKPQAPYTTSKLQQEAYNRLGFSASRTMRIAQSLYEGVDLGGEEGSVGLITYMRTDSVNIAEIAKKEAVKFIKEHYGDDYLPKTPNLYRSKKGAQEAHEAIRPTSAYRDPEQVKQFLNEEQHRLYELIWRKFLASQMTPAVDLVTSVEILAGSEYFFKAAGTRNLFPGFTAVFTDLSKNSKKDEKDEKDEKSEDDDEEEDDQEFPDLDQDELLKLHELIGTQHFTKPPARYNDASLVKVLEERGIGRPSTYAPIIYTLVNRDYVERKGGAIMPTELGETVIGLLVEHFPYILDIDFTALMEEELDKIEEGQMDWIKVLQDFYVPFEAHLKEAKTHMKDMRQDPVPTGEDCDKCGKPMMIKWGRFGKFVACSGFPECKNTKSISTGVDCPKEGCGGYLVARKGKGRRKFFGCSKYPNCDFIANQLPTKDSAEQTTEEKPPEIEEVGEDL